MTTDHDVPGDPLPADLVRHLHEYVSAFNSGDAAAIGRAYEADAVLVPRPGSPVTGPGRTDATAHLMSYGLRMEALLRHAYVAGDVALLVVDWSIRGTTCGGTPVEMAGSAPTSSAGTRARHGGTWWTTPSAPILCRTDENTKPASTACAAPSATAP